jgi:hypothetical protein
MKSFGLLRTNVGLTTNIRIVVDSGYNLTLDSIESTDELSVDKYKKVKFTKKNYFDELIAYFYKGLPASLAYKIKYENDVDKMTSDFSKQYDEIYQYGARNISNNKNYKEEFEYFAPLYIDKNNLPKNFMIFRVDGPGVELMTKENFVNDVASSFKLVKNFDLSRSTSLGEWLYNNFTNNKSFPIAPLEIDFRELEFCKWNGIDFTDGGYTSKSFFIDDYLEEEKEIYELEKFVFDSYEKNNIVFPNILNFSFLFDDEPSSPEVKRKWSINRYYGFYIDKMERVKTISPFKPVRLRRSATITKGNYITIPSGGDPFIPGFSEKNPTYIEYNGEYYKVERTTEVLKNQLSTISIDAKSIDKVLDKKAIKDGKFDDKPIDNKTLSKVKDQRRVEKLPAFQNPDTFVPKKFEEKYINVERYRYKIISDVDLSGKEDYVNQNFGQIDDENVLIDIDGYMEVWEDFDKYSVWLIEIDGILHNLVNDDGQIKLVTDYSFTFSENDYTYKVAGKETKVNLRVDVENEPKKFSIYRICFSDIKDFDTRIVDTEPSKFEYIKDDELTKTDESKMYVENLLTTSEPKDYDDYIYKGEVVNIPVSSEYTANYETFKIEKGQLSDIWRKNSVYCRWGFMNSISANDYPYVLNNSIIFEDFNRTTNPFEAYPRRVERNLDYFYSLNSSTASYKHHSLHIEEYDENGDLVPSFNFDTSKYLNVYTYSTEDGYATYSLDYFTDFFYRKQQFSNGEIVKNVKKYSEFVPGDNTLPNETVFRGLKVQIWDVDSVEFDEDGSIENINLSTNNNYEGYKFSILLTDENYQVSQDGKFSTSTNTLEWEILKEWTMDKDYASGSVGLSEDILYVATDDVNTIEPVRQFLLANSDEFLEGGFPIPLISKPSSEPKWAYFSPTSSIFWQPTRAIPYKLGDFVYNNDEFYKCIYTGTGEVDFFNPEISRYGGYDKGDVVLYKGKYWKSEANNNPFAPDTNEKLTREVCVEVPSDVDLSIDGPGQLDLDINLNVNIDISNVSLKDFSFKDVNLDVSTDPQYYCYNELFSPWVVIDETNPTLQETDFTKGRGLSFALTIGNFSIGSNNSSNNSNTNTSNPNAASLKPKWDTIDLWNQLIAYPALELVVHNRTIWKNVRETKVGEEPGLSSNWEKQYSFEIDTNTVYGPTNNPVIEIGDNFYLCKANPNNSTFQNGVNIFINKKWKNVYININVADRTLPNIRNCDRDQLYNETFKRLTADNFINYVNDLDKKHGFIDYVNYIIIDEKGKISRHSFSENLKTLPCLIRIEEPDEFTIKPNSLKWEVNENPEKLNPLRKLNDGRINNLSQLNWYNDLPYSAVITQNKERPKITKNSHGGRDFTEIKMWRHSGYYTPIFYDIDLFDKGLDGISDNTKFDEDLTYFGMIMERKIQKVNRNGSILKLRNEGDIDSIYPMLDEFGYTIRDFFIFASTWDLRYHYEAYILTFRPKFDIVLPTIKSSVIKDFGQPKGIQVTNRKKIDL